MFFVVSEWGENVLILVVEDSATCIGLSIASVRRFRLRFAVECD